MNKKQAVAEAKQRWGDKAEVRGNRDGYTVGWKVGDVGFFVEGRGATWEEAFGAADELERHRPERLERVRAALRIMRGDDVTDPEAGWVRDVLRGQAGVDERLRGIVAHIRDVCEWGRRHHGDTPGLGGLAAFADVQERRLAAFLATFPPVPASCLFCTKPLPDAGRDALPVCLCVGNRPQMDAFLRYAEARAEALEVILKSLSVLAAHETEQPN